jgi:hypothetical protein
MTFEKYADSLNIFFAIYIIIYITVHNTVHYIKIQGTVLTL